MWVDIHYTCCTLRWQLKVAHMHVLELEEDTCCTIENRRIKQLSTFLFAENDESYSQNN